MTAPQVASAPVGATVIVVTWTEVGNPDCAVFTDIASANTFCLSMRRTKGIIPSILTRSVIGSNGR